MAITVTYQILSTEVIKKTDPSVINADGSDSDENGLKQSHKTMDVTMQEVLFIGTPDSDESDSRRMSTILHLKQGADSAATNAILADATTHIQTRMDAGNIPRALRLINEGR